MTEDKQVSGALAEMLVSLKLIRYDHDHGNGIIPLEVEEPISYFDIQLGIRNYYRLKDGDSLLCKLVELRPKDPRTPLKKIGKDILVDITVYSDISYVRGCFSSIDFNQYQMKQYDLALLRIEEVIRDSRCE